MKKIVLTLVAFLVLFGFYITGAMAQSWMWTEAYTFTASSPYALLRVDPADNTLYGRTSPSDSGTLITLDPSNQVSSPDQLPFSSSFDSSLVQYPYLGPNGIEYGVITTTVGYELPGLSSYTALADQPIVPTNASGSQFLAIAVGNDGKLYVLFQDNGDKQYILVGTPPAVTVRFAPRTLNLSSKGNWVTCKISDFPQGYTTKDVDLESLYIVSINDVLLDESTHIPRDSNGPSNMGKKKLMVKFDRGDLATQISSNLVSGETTAKITVSGYSEDGTLQFYGTDTINTKVPKGHGKKK